MRELVAIDLPRDERYREVIQRLWDSNMAFFPVDQRLSLKDQKLQLEVARPAAIISAGGDTHALPNSEPLQDDDAYVVLTSGTTGGPKGVVHTFASIAASTKATHDYLGFDNAQHRWHCALPPAHVGGLSIILRSINSNTPLTMSNGFGESEIEDALQHGATHISIVRAALQSIDPKRFTRLLLGGQAPPKELPSNVVTTYGMTESGSGVVYDGDPLDGVSVKIADDGEIYLACAMLASRYRDGTPLVDSAGWYHTGDLGSLNAQGKLEVFGRKSEVINTGGEKVMPIAVEEALRSFPGISDVTVFGVSDDRWGEAVTAVIVVDDSLVQRAVTLKALRAHVQEELPPWYAPKAIYRATALPKTALGKTQKAVVSSQLKTLDPLA